MRRVMIVGLLGLACTPDIDGIRWLPSAEAFRRAGDAGAPRWVLVYRASPD